MFDNNNDSEIAMVAQAAVSQKTEKMVEYIRNLKTLEDAMEPYKEQKLTELLQAHEKRKKKSLTAPKNRVIL